MRAPIACTLLLAFAFQASGCAFDTASAPESAAARTESSVEQSADSSHHPMTWLTSAVASVVYFPAKLLFAVGGGAVSALTYVVTFGRAQPARSIWNASVDGDYLVTPLMIEGGDRVHFIGG